MQEELIIEAALLTTVTVLTDKELCQLFNPVLKRDKFEDVMQSLQARWQDRAIHLVRMDQGWRFQVKEAIYSKIPHLIEEKNPRYSRAVLETLSIIAYKQPVTRADIEEIRGVSVSTQIMQTLSERNWITVVGHKAVPGKPSLWATSSQFLLDFGLESLEQLPPLAELGELTIVE